MRYKIIETPEFQGWIKSETARSKVQIQLRLANIENEGHFGVHKNFDSDISELKWGGGRRVYYTIIPINNVLLLLGGNKNGQSQDIIKAEKIFRKYKKND